MTEPKEASAPISEDLFDPARLNNTECGALIVALLFASGEVVPAERLAEFLDIDESTLEVLVEEAAGGLRPLGLDILPAAEGYRLVTASQWDSYLRMFSRELKRAKLTKSSLEILAIIAYEQPVPRSRVDEIRQVNSESTIRTLLDKRLITVAGRADTPGRPFLYKTTDQFLEVFGLRALDDLPPRPASLDAEPAAPGAAEDEDQQYSVDDLPGFEDEQFDGELED